MQSSKNEHITESHLYDVLTINYESVLYIPFLDNGNSGDYQVFRANAKLENLINSLFNGSEDEVKRGSFGQVIVYEEDCQKLWTETRKSYVLQKLEEDTTFYVLFRAFVDGQLHHFKIKYVANMEGRRLCGIIMALIDNGAAEKIQRRQELEMYQAIDNAERTIMKKTAELRERTLSLSFANSEVIDLLGNVVELRNGESGLHIKRVKAYTKVLANQVMADYPEYGLDKETVDMIVSASSLHDIGKIMIPDSILLKKGKLTPEEFEIMKKHSECSMEILRLAPKSWTAQYTKIALNICCCHHEKWDGKGYPNGLKGDQIPICAQIVAIADCYDALTTERVYKPAYSPEVSYNMIMNGECGAFSEKMRDVLKKSKDKFEEIAKNPELYVEKSVVHLSGENKLKGLNILLVDDSEISLEINADILENEGANISQAENGLEAIRKFKGEGPYDVIIMDIVMPQMDGIEATKKIRELEQGTGNRTPVIALSAEGSDYQSLQEAGIDASMAKPLIVGELTRILISCMHNSSIQMQKQLLETLKIANTDPLTSVKNIAAYTDMLASLNNEIKENPQVQFALVVCDINELKVCNDTFGHETGDIYIKNCSKLLCHAFEHSPVYRIGGDEFVIVLQGEDYNNRIAKIKALQEKIMETSCIKEYIDGRASLAVGMSDYNPHIDADAQEVQAKADAIMYSNKRRMKEGLKK